MFRCFFLFWILISLHFLQANKYEEVPILDLQEFQSLNLQSQNEFVEKLGAALTNYGFVLIINHDISVQRINEAYESVNIFFNLSLDLKNRYKGVELNRGYKSYEPDRKDKKSDLQEYWHVGPEISLEECRLLGLPLISENVWPEKIAFFRENLSSLYEEISWKCQPILEACSLYMGKEREFLSRLTRYGDSVMRVIHYLPNGAQKGDWKASHRDPNLLTVIVGVSMQGLELELPNGMWISVPFVQDAIVVSASNMLESLSNGLIRSAPHRVVVLQADKSRYSIPFFFHVQRDLSIGPVAECLKKTGGEALYPSITAEESLMNHQWFSPSRIST